MSDPRGGTGIHLQLQGDGAWPDMQGRQVWKAQEIHVAALAKGTKEGHASLMFRFDFSKGRTVIAEMTLRELHSLDTAIVGAYGEDWMKPETSDMDLRISLTLQEVLRQLVEARAKLGLPPIIDFTAADKAYDEMKRKQRAT